MNATIPRHPLDAIDDRPRSEAALAVAAAWLAFMTGLMVGGELNDLVSVFWRWGLPYAIVAHAAGNAAHLALQDTLF